MEKNIGIKFWLIENNDENQEYKMKNEENLTREYGRFTFGKINDKIFSIEALVMRVTPKNLKEKLEEIFNDFSINGVKSLFKDNYNYVISTKGGWIYLSLNRCAYEDGTNKYKDYSDLYAIGDSYLIDKLANDIKKNTNLKNK